MERRPEDGSTVRMLSSVRMRFCLASLFLVYLCFLKALLPDAGGRHKNPGGWTDRPGGWGSTAVLTTPAEDTLNRLRVQPVAECRPR